MMAASYFKLRILKSGKHALQIRMLTSNNTATKVIGNSGLTEKYSSNCRVCLMEGSISIFSETTSISALELFTGIKISENDNLPKYMCDSCHSLLQNAIFFRKKAQSTYKLFIQLMQHESAEINEAFSKEKLIQNGNSNEIIYSNNMRYKCKTCKMNFRNSKDLMEHRNSKHKNIRIRCRICQRILTAQSYKKHLARHQCGSHVCEICGKLYRKDNLVRHLQLHSHELPFKCNICPYRGRFAVSLKLHMSSHTGLKPFKCDKCQFCFLTRSNLNRHILTHNKVRPHKCGECGRGFYVQKDLDLHLKSNHAGIKDFDCKFCGNKYSTKKALMRHELRLHKRAKMAKGPLPLYLQPEYKI